MVCKENIKLLKGQVSNGILYNFLSYKFSESVLSVMKYHSERQELWKEEWKDTERSSVQNIKGVVSTPHILM